MLVVERAVLRIVEELIFEPFVKRPIGLQVRLVTDEQMIVVLVHLLLTQALRPQAELIGVALEITQTELIRLRLTVDHSQPRCQRLHRLAAGHAAVLVLTDQVRGQGVTAAGEGQEAVHLRLYGQACKRVLVRCLVIAADERQAAVGTEREQVVVSQIQEPAVLQLLRIDP